VEDVALASFVPSSSVTDPNDHMAIVRGGVDPDIFGATLSSSGWSAWDNFEIFRVPGFAFDLEPANFIRLDVAKTTEGLHVLGVDQIGRMFHQLRPPATPDVAIFRDVELVGMGKDFGSFRAVACGS